MPRQRVVANTLDSFRNGGRLPRLFVTPVYFARFVEISTGCLKLSRKRLLRFDERRSRPRITIRYYAAAEKQSKILSGIEQVAV
jgi:hypothetical protein